MTAPADPDLAEGLETVRAAWGRALEVLMIDFELVAAKIEAAGVSYDVLDGAAADGFASATPTLREA
ncbi:MAG: hypothetical protein ACRD29_13350 [Acidimicrobiales bacterium]